MDDVHKLIKKFQRAVGLDKPKSKCLYVCFCNYKKDDSVSYFLDKFTLGPVISPGNSPSFKNFLIEDDDSFDFDFHGAILRLSDDVRASSSLDIKFSRAQLKFPDQNHPSGFDFCRSEPQIQMGLSANGNSSFILAGGVVGKFQPLRMGFDAYPSSEAYCVNPISFQDFGGSKGLVNLDKLPDLLQGKVKPLLVPLGGKIYAVSGNAVSYPTSPYFEVLDLQRGHWSLLPDPPVFPRYSTNTNSDASSTDITVYPEPPSPEDITYAVAGNNILVSSSYTPTFRFDTADPTKGWRELVLSDGGKFEFHGTTLVVDVGHRSILFAYGGNFMRLCHLTISVHMMSNVFDSIVPIPPVRLPEDQLPVEFRIYPPDGSTFLDLGGGTVCLLLSRFMGPFSKFEHETAKMILLLVKFQFKITENKAFLLEVKFLGTHTIEYSHSKRSKVVTADVEMMGAFLQ